jgi:hypothetical protein
VAHPAKPPLDTWCLAAVLVALLLGWCPLGSLAAIIMAGIGLRRVVASQGALRGTGLAWTAMALGVAIPLIEGVALERMQAVVVADMDEQASATVAGILREEDLPAGRVLPNASGGPSTEEQRELARTVSAALGELREVRITHRAAEGILNPVISATFIAEYTRGSAFGNAEFTTGTLHDFAPVLILRSLEVEAQGRRQRIPVLPVRTPERAATPRMDNLPAPEPAPEIPPSPETPR